MAKVELIRDIEREIIENAAQAYFPPILEEDPELAALSLTTQDSLITIKAINNVYEDLINNSSPRHPYFQEAITYSFYNFTWFTTFYKKLVEEHNSQEAKIPYSVAPEPDKSTTLKVQPPMYVASLGDTLRIFYEEFPVPKRTIIFKHRISYIFKGYEAREFKRGYPSWYSIKDTVVFEKYCEKTNKRVKIVYNTGEFKYYISGASDNWQEIFDVPLEIDDVISALLFRN